MVSVKRPYHIVAPAYTEKSAGARALHLLCDALNRVGEKAFIVPMENPVLNPELKTPLVSVRDSEAIAVYPEIVEGNPLSAKTVVRYLLYYAGRYRGNRDFPKSDMVYGYTKRIARDYGTDDVLFLPTVDDTVFVPPAKEQGRKGNCFYSHKYRWFYGKLPQEHGVEITNPEQSREEVIKLLQTSEVFYTYEDTSLIIEAALCGCPVVCVPSEAFKECCGLEEFNKGVAWGEDELYKAIATVRQAKKQYQELKEDFKMHLQAFIEKTQARAHG